ncbi:MAG: hypothetical protein Q4B73_01225 [Lachnospiraceae bacterium]|nr:hypothetical protein [Lachnospiraceae bacterium]
MGDSFMMVIDVVIVVVLLAGIVSFLVGKGDYFMTLFKSNKSGPSPYDPEKEKKATFLLLIVLLLCELSYIFIAPRWTPATLIAMGVLVIALAVYIWYLKKFASR